MYCPNCGSELSGNGICPKCTPENKPVSEISGENLKEINTKALKKRMWFVPIASLSIIIKYFIPVSLFTPSVSKAYGFNDSGYSVWELPDKIFIGGEALFYFFLLVFITFVSTILYNLAFIGAEKPEKRKCLPLIFIPFIINQIVSVFSDLMRGITRIFNFEPSVSNTICVSAELILIVLLMSIVTTIICKQIEKKQQVPSSNVIYKSCAWFVPVSVLATPLFTATSLLVDFLSQKLLGISDSGSYVGEEAVIFSHKMGITNVLSTIPSIIYIVFLFVLPNIVFSELKEKNNGYKLLPLFPIGINAVLSLILSSIELLVSSLTGSNITIVYVVCFSVLIIFSVPAAILSYKYAVSYLEKYAGIKQKAPAGTITVTDENGNIFAVSENSTKSRLAAGLLCFFLGELGIHRFYAGKIGTGLIWFFTAGLFGFGWLIDLFVIIFGGFKDSEGKTI